jgi:hypothetical protein
MNLFSVFYHLDRKVWLQWDYDIEKYDIYGETKDEKVRKVKMTKILTFKIRVKLHRMLLELPETEISLTTWKTSTRLSSRT